MELVFAVFSIILLDLVLAGDNAVVIGMASRTLPEKERMKAILLGTAGAVGLRIFFTAIVTVLLQIPLLHAIGGVLLLGIAYKLLIEDSNHEVSAADSLMGAIRTIILADAVMSLDNVLAVAGAAHGNIWLVVFGLIVSIPIVVWGSQLVARLMDRYPVIIYIGAGILVWTGAKMLLGDEFLHRFVAITQPLQTSVSVLLLALILGVGYMHNRRTAEAHAQENSAKD